ncbi:hypothetical protein JMJ77_0013150, partial [Colletotrichum scovillei]
SSASGIRAGISSAGTFSEVIHQNHRRVHLGYSRNTQVAKCVRYSQECGTNKHGLREPTNPFRRLEECHRSQN